MSEDIGLGFSLFARRYLGYHAPSRSFVQALWAKLQLDILLSFPSGTEMFHFPEFAPYRSYPVGSSSKLEGFPIQRSPDQRLQTASPKLIAG
jgi:hypothetical protein